MDKYSVPKATLGRLPLYLQYLKNLPANSNKNISATTIAKYLKLGEVQVRKDLAAVSDAGKPKIGYATNELLNKSKTVWDITILLRQFWSVQENLVVHCLNMMALKNLE